MTRGWVAFDIYIKEYQDYWEWPANGNMGINATPSQVSDRNGEIKLDRRKVTLSASVSLAKFSSSALWDAEFVKLKLNIYLRRFIGKVFKARSGFFFLLTVRVRIERDKLKN